MLKIQILPEQCIACGICAALFPKIFDYDDDGIVCLIASPTNEIVIDAAASLTEAQRKCPTQAIKISSYKLQ
ncbi:MULTISPECIES: ferredoxin [unclassified Enterococcus]|uniref:ferredoxin n=1 Tax=unclassified Enterococcus TaxID=2608891 RepID=UPI001555AD5B|nr:MULTISPECIES: ferredoxin [unclassified Enterococcus]MBS7576211.1 ferredoxin [Enterococcus sp. MMGLQ5-2]MBS7583444.1 ferredoxin [Enterococcus sp. MMGLQ5-1]NPD11304.1 ferredoxin [Enterococcus sp. MMGLQ5-1]NPD36047.1 ferredoxin [Enterococcus sp. MMGLQ5-2]